MANTDRDLTTGEVAQICSSSQRTVAKWIDKGLLQGYRLPLSKDRRVPIQRLRLFLEKHGMPINRLLQWEKDHDQCTS